MSLFALDALISSRALPYHFIHGVGLLLSCPDDISRETEALDAPFKTKTESLNQTVERLKMCI